MGKNAVRNLQYGPRTRLVRGIYTTFEVRPTYVPNKHIKEMLYLRRPLVQKSRVQLPNTVLQGVTGSPIIWPGY